jgi:glycosyltransferase involved in cell wall biosynthesis
MSLYKISIIIPHYNRIAALIQTLLGLARQTLSAEFFEVIIVDDGSTDDSPAIINMLAPPYALSLYQQTNRGPGAARNLGADHSRAELLVFLDADMAPSEGLLSEYWAAHAENPRTVIMGRQLLWKAAYPPGFPELYAFSLAYDLGPEPLAPPFYTLASGNFAIDRASFIQLGGFDERFMAAEDVELGYRATRCNIPILYNPKAIGYHNHPKTLDAIYRQSRASARWTARLMEKYPQIRGQIPTFRPLEFIDWRHDPPPLLLKKLLYRLAAFLPCLVVLGLIGKLLHRIPISARLQQRIHFGIQMANIYIGFHRGFENSSD